jgi:hypothetical protein
MQLNSRFFSSRKSARRSWTLQLPYPSTNYVLHHLEVGVGLHCAFRRDAAPLHCLLRLGRWTTAEAGCGTGCCRGHPGYPQRKADLCSPRPMSKPDLTVDRPRPGIADVPFWFRFCILFMTHLQVTTSILFNQNSQYHRK